MADQNAPIVRHMGTAKERLAGINAARVWHQDLAAAHLLRTQAPIGREPIDPPAKT